MTRNNRPFCAWALLIALTAALCGCETFSGCSPENCAGDRQTLAEVTQALASHRELGPPAAIHAQVINGVVYLSGEVNTELEIRSAESIVLQVAGVKDVVNSLNTVGNSR